MPTLFEFATATRIVFGPGTSQRVPAEVKALGASRVLLVTGKDGARAAWAGDALAAAGLAPVPFRTPGEPTVDLAREAVARARAERCDAVVSVGGGSAIDLGKAAAGLLGNGGDPLDYLEVVGKGAPLTRPALPFVAVPTTAGTGAEVTRNAVLGAPEAGVKASLRSPFLLPRLALVDPELLRGLPRAVLASSGLDALAQVVEPYLSARANPLTDALALEGMRRSARALRGACTSEDGPDAAAREDLALASLFGGLCLANAGLGAVHGFAAPLGGRFDAPHGAVCGALLAPSLATNLVALRARAPQSPALARLSEVARLLSGRADAAPEDAVAWVRALVSDLDVPRLGTYGLTEAEIPALVERAKAASSMKANPIALTDGELAGLLRAAM